MIGRSLSHYEILEPLGSGGMGEVYRARDTKLNRDVALKTILPSVAEEPDRLRRFQQEAQALHLWAWPDLTDLAISPCEL